ncbi:hypothetical protein MNB_SV-15-344 [hydrothermal vent metagenome]|uniref:Uncharacterized protein n=1 Tax=hydrothermal vent metagenome TaxID=652676 RepID=A0A1W1EIG7_9ZZZZ
MASIKSLLNIAQKSFLNEKFDDSLIKYGLILRDNPTLKEAKVGVFLSDLALDNEMEAKALFEYYQIIKDEKDDADVEIDEIIKDLYITQTKIQNLFLKPLQEQSEFENGIKYDDFLSHIKYRENFREALEDIICSTKVILTNRDEFRDFIIQLIENGFNDMATSYLDNTAYLFGNDQEILKLYELVGNSSESRVSK